MLISLMRGTNRYQSVRVGDEEIPHVDTAKYLGLVLDAKLRWKAHIKKKREELDIKCTGC